MARRETPEINAGSMADIAFLLLIFFLVTTTMDIDTGISRKLPEKQPEDVEPPVLKMKNVFEVYINRNNEILVESDQYMKVDEIREAAIKFIDNGGGQDPDGNDCTWCEGDKDPNSSDHPKKAIIAIQSDRGTDYGTFVSVQNELVGAYNFLRDRYANKKYGKKFDELTKSQQSLIKTEIYPQIISEQEPTK